MLVLLECGRAAGTLSDAECDKLVIVTRRCGLGSLTKDRLSYDQDLTPTAIVLSEVVSTYSLYSWGIYVRHRGGWRSKFQLPPVSPLNFAEGFLFVFGGQDENKQTLSSGEKYDPDANTWTALPPMNEVKSSFSFAFIVCLSSL